jgi:hypothetical protein
MRQTHKQTEFLEYRPYLLAAAGLVKIDKQKFRERERYCNGPNKKGKSEISIGGTSLTDEFGLHNSPVSLPTGPGSSSSLPAGPGGKSHNSN